jgi:hypothetical protein
MGDVCPITTSMGDNTTRRRPLLLGQRSFKPMANCSRNTETWILISSIRWFREVKFHDMSFGWILTTPTSKRLAAAAEPCNGRGNSLQTEGAGMLSVTMSIALI